MDDQAELNLNDLFQLLRRGLVFAVAVAAGAGLLTYFLSKRTTPEYDSTTTLLASRPNNNTQSTFGVSLVTAPVVDTSAYQAAAKSYPVLIEALATLGEEDPNAKTVADFAKLVAVRLEVAQQSSLIRVTVRDADPEWAAKAANALGAALLHWDTARAKQNLQVVVNTLETQVQSFDSEIAALSSAPDGGASAISQLDGLRTLRADRTMQLNAVRALSASAVGLLEVLEPARPALEPSRPRPTRNAALAFALGIFLVYALLLLRDSLDTRFRGADDVLGSTGFPVLGEFPRLPAGTFNMPHEATGYLRTNVMFATAQDLPKVILVTSAQPTEGKTSVAIGLAESFARNDYRTVLIDADMRRPAASARLGLTRTTISPRATLRAYLEDPSLVKEPTSTELDGLLLDIIPTFEPAPTPTELLSRSFASVLHRLKDDYDVIVIDSPPTLPVADAMTIAPYATGVILAVSLPTADRRAVKATLDLLERINVRILGTVITNVEPNRSLGGARGYGYGYGYGYGPAENAQASQAERAPIRPVANRSAADD